MEEKLNQFFIAYQTARWRNFTSEVLIDQIFLVGAQESIAEHQVQTAEQEMIGVDQIISNHAEITWKHIRITVAFNNVYRPKPSICWKEIFVSRTIEGQVTWCPES